MIMSRVGTPRSSMGQLSVLVKTTLYQFLQIAFRTPSSPGLPASGLNSLTWNLSASELEEVLEISSLAIPYTDSYTDMYTHSTNGKLRLEEGRRMPNWQEACV